MTDATHIVGLNLSNDYNTYSYWEDIYKREGKEECSRLLEESLEEWVMEIKETLEQHADYSGLLLVDCMTSFLADVDYQELADNFQES